MLHFANDLVGFAVRRYISLVGQGVVSHGTSEYPEESQAEGKRSPSADPVSCALFRAETTFLFSCRDGNLDFQICNIFSKGTQARARQGQMSSLGDGIVFFMFHSSHECGTTIPFNVFTVRI